MKTLFFDLGNVLLFFDHRRMEDQVAKLCNLDHKVVETTLRSHWDAYEKGQIDTRAVLKALGADVPLEEFMRAVGDIFVLPNHPVIELALKLKEKGHPLFLLSNTCEAHFKYALEHYPFLRQFDGYVLSYEAGASKPERSIYETALKIAGCSAEECFYTDDIPEYVTAARSLNIDAAQYSTPEELMEHLTNRKIL